MWMNPKAILSSSISEPWPWLAPWPTAASARKWVPPQRRSTATAWGTLGKNHGDSERIPWKTGNSMEFWGIIENRMVVALCYLLPQPKNGWFIIITNDLVMENHHFQCVYHLLQISISSNIIKDLQISDVPVWVYCHVWVPEGPGCGMAGTPPSSLSRMVHFRDTHPFLKMVGMAGNHTFQSAGGSCTGKKKLGSTVHL